MAFSSSGVPWDRLVAADHKPRRLHPLLVVRVLLGGKTAAYFIFGTITSLLAWVGFPVGFVAFPILLLAGWHLVRHARDLRLLRSGRPAPAQLLRVDREIPKDRGYGSRVTRSTCHFTFRAEDGREHRLFVETLDPKPLTDDLVEAVLYEPTDPGRAVLLGSLPGDPRLTDDGTFTVKDPQRVPLFLLPPVAFVVVNTVGWRWIFGG